MGYYKEMVCQFPPLQLLPSQVFQESMPHAKPSNLAALVPKPIRKQERTLKREDMCASRDPFALRNSPATKLVDQVTPKDTTPQPRPNNALLTTKIMMQLLLLNASH